MLCYVTAFTTQLTETKKKKLQIKLDKAALGHK